MLSNDNDFNSSFETYFIHCQLQITHRRALINYILVCTLLLLFVYTYMFETHFSTLPSIYWHINNYFDICIPAGEVSAMMWKYIKLKISWMKCERRGNSNSFHRSIYGGKLSRLPFSNFDPSYGTILLTCCSPMSSENEWMKEGIIEKRGKCWSTITGFQSFLLQNLISIWPTIVLSVWCLCVPIQSHCCQYIYIYIYI